MDRLLDGEALDAGTEATAAEVGGEAVDGIAVARLAAVARMDDDGDAGLVHPRPERIEPRVERDCDGRWRWWARRGA